MDVSSSRSLAPSYVTTLVTTCVFRLMRSRALQEHGEAAGPPYRPPITDLDSRSPRGSLQTQGASLNAAVIIAARHPQSVIRPEADHPHRLTCADMWPGPSGRAEAFSSAQLNELRTTAIVVCESVRQGCSDCSYLLCIITLIITPDLNKLVHWLGLSLRLLALCLYQI